jgi:hypothetical protein
MRQRNCRTNEPVIFRLADHWCFVKCALMGAMPTLAVGMLAVVLGDSHAHGKRGHGTQLINPRLTEH